MPCVLRISGESLDVDALLATIALRYYRLWRKGESRCPDKPLEKTQNSGVCFLVSDAPMNDLFAQLEEASTFLEQHQSEIAKILMFRGIDNATLDFGIALNGELPVYRDILSRRFLKAAATAGIEVELSHYVCNDDCED